MPYLLGIDIGTSKVKALIISSDGEIIATESEPYPIYSPNQGWSEQNPIDWWNSTKKAVKKIINKSDIDKSSLAGFSLTGQMHSLVILDENYDVIRPAILWNDTRTKKQCEQIYEKTGGLKNLINMVANPALEGFTAPKILWVKENEPSNYKKIRHVLLPKDYIRYKLTGEIKSEVSDNAGTLLFDVKGKKWSKEILKLLDIKREILPESVNSTDVAGYITKSVERDIGIKEGTPVVAGGADNACGAIGSGIIKEGRVMISIGTSGVVLAQSNKALPDLKGRIHLFNHSYPDKYYMMGVMLSATGSFNWLKEKLFQNKYNIEELNNIASNSIPGSQGLIFLPYLNGERTPHGDPNARGVYFGISNTHNNSHFVRSTMEGVAFGLRDSYELIKNKEISIDEIRLIGGGAKSSLWCQILSDILGEELSLINIEEGPAFGAAIIAGVGTQVFNSFDEAEENFIKIKNTIKPNPNNFEMYNKNYEIYKTLYERLEDVFNRKNYI